VRGRLIPYGLGAVSIGVGFTGLLVDASDTHPVGWAIWFAGAAIAHDALLAPLIFGAAYLTGRVPGPAPLRVALVLAGSVTLVALPLVWQEGRRPDNPSILPGAYGTTIIVLVGLITAAAVIANAYSHRMGKAILTIVGVLLSIWLIFMVIGMIISALKFLIWVGFLAVIGAIIVTVISKLAKSS
jgi:hypothetical protein